MIRLYPRCVMGPLSAVWDDPALSTVCNVSTERCARWSGSSRCGMGPLSAVRDDPAHHGVEWVHWALCEMIRLITVCNGSTERCVRWSGSSQCVMGPLSAVWDDLAHHQKWVQACMKRPIFYPKPDMSMNFNKYHENEGDPPPPPEIEGAHYIPKYIW